MKPRDKMRVALISIVLSFLSGFTFGWLGSQNVQISLILGLISILVALGILIFLKIIE